MFGSFIVRLHAQLAPRLTRPPDALSREEPERAGGRVRPRLGSLEALRGARTHLGPTLARTYDSPASGATLPSNGGKPGPKSDLRFESGNTLDAYVTRTLAGPSPLAASRKRRQSGRSPGGGPS